MKSATMTVFYLIVACVGMSVRAETQESSALEAGRRFDLTAPLDKTAAVKGESGSLIGSIRAGSGLVTDLTTSTRGGALDKEVPAPSGPDGKKPRGREKFGVALGMAVGGLLMAGTVAFGAKVGFVLGGPVGAVLGVGIAGLFILTMAGFDMSGEF